MFNLEFSLQKKSFWMLEISLLSPMPRLLDLVHGDLHCYQIRHKNQILNPSAS